MAPKPRPPIERFNEHIAPAANGCIEWTAWVGDNGYGRFWIDGRNANAHRWSYEYHVGPIPDGLVIDHLCRNRRCVNPEHLEPVTIQENTIRGIGPQLATARASERTHCPKGHPYTEENTYRCADGRACLTCKRAAARADYERNREAVIERSRQWRLSNLDRSRELAREGQRRYRARKREAAA